jgi:hypothetical protein
MNATLFLVLFAVCALVAVASLLPDWRRFMSRASDLPFWSFMRRRGTAPTGTEILEAKLRCELCASQAECRHLIAAGAEWPVADCPNLELLQERQPFGGHEARAAEEAH